MSHLTKLQNHGFSKKELKDLGFQLLGSGESNDIEALRNHVRKYNIQNFPFREYVVDNNFYNGGKKNIKQKFYATNNFQYSSEYKKENFLLLESTCKELFMEVPKDENFEDLVDVEDSDEEIYGNVPSRKNQISIQHDFSDEDFEKETNEEEREDKDEKTFIHVPPRKFQNHVTTDNDDSSESESTIESVPPRKLQNRFIMDDFSYEEVQEEEFEDDIQSFIDDRSESELTIESEDSLLDKL